MGPAQAGPVGVSLGGDALLLETSSVPLAHFWVGFSGEPWGRWTTLTAPHRKCGPSLSIDTVWALWRHINNAMRRRKSI